MFGDPDGVGILPETPTHEPQLTLVVQGGPCVLQYRGVPKEGINGVVPGGKYIIMF